MSETEDKIAAAPSKPVLMRGLKWTAPDRSAAICTCAGALSLCDDDDCPRKEDAR